MTPAALVRKALIEGSVWLARAAHGHSERQLTVAYTWPDFSRKARALHSLLSRRGFAPTLVRPKNKLDYILTKARDNDVWIGFWNEFPTDCLPDRYIFYNAEPLGLGRWKANNEWLCAMRGSAEVWNYHPVAEAVLTRELGGWRQVPFGYVKLYEEEFRESVGDSIPEAMDVMFMGTITNRRTEVLHKLRQAGLSVLEVTRRNPLYGRQLDEAIANAKVVVHVHQYDDPRSHVADLARLDYLLSNGRCVVHERTSGLGDPSGFSHAVPSGSFDEIVDVCRMLVADAKARRSAAAMSRNWFRETLDMDSYLPYDTVERLLSE